MKRFHFKENIAYLVPINTSVLSKTVCHHSKIFEFERKVKKADAVFGVHSQHFDC
jgi:hypothetical protein